MFLLRRHNLPRILLRSQYSTTTTGSSATIDQNELERLSAFSKEWWKEDGIMSTLHRYNVVRVPMIENQLFQVGKISKRQLNSKTPLQNISTLEVGCGGGLFSEPLAKRGASVIGLDPSEELLQVAITHQQEQNLPNLTYIQDTIENYSKTNKNKFDVVIVSETIEHVAEQEMFMEKSVECLKPGGSIFVTTNNRTLLSKLIGIFYYENIAKCIPKGVHDYNKFIHIKTMEEMLKKLNCETVFRTGLIFNPWTKKWSAINATHVWYAVQAIKNEKN